MIVGLSDGGKVGGKGGPPDGKTVGTLSVDGDYQQLASGLLALDIPVLAAGQFDVLAVTGQAEVGGELALTPGDDLPMYAPTEIVQAASVLGQFATVSGGVLDPETGLAVTYSPTAVDVQRALLGDLTLDGRIDYVDLGILATNYDRSGVGWSEGDLGGNGLVDYTDLGMLATNYDKVFQPSPGAVPEPAGLLLLALGAASVARRRRNLLPSRAVG